MAIRYHTATFENIPPEKRERILRAASRVLGRDGIGGARMADVASEAGVSHGSMFSYFPTKDDMVRAVIARGMDIQAVRFAASDDEGACFADAVRAVFRSAWDEASAEPELISLWLSLSLAENARFADAILPLESDSTERWRRVVARGKASGEIDGGVDERAAAYLLDALAAQLMKSRASGLERAKLELFVGSGLAESAPDRMADAVVAMLSSSDSSN
ncbi:MAG TPA: helix-turn-helix domain-containing protein [Spirochaetia bacterium]|nr:helix-turn-helix domain-containing protein [Spirochaetales bacterium]HRW24042.1 helix-turn-helix domain-containing protein [Spirochaetia bacterium]